MSRTVPDTIRSMVLERSGHRCERCGIRMPLGLHMSHRQARGMGGALSRKVVEHHRTANINALCGMCHLVFVEKEIRLAEQDGWRVRRGTQPEDVPVKTWEGWRYLTNDGRYSERVEDSETTPQSPVDGEEDEEAQPAPHTR